MKTWTYEEMKIWRYDDKNIWKYKYMKIWMCILDDYFLYPKVYITPNIQINIPKIHPVHTKTINFISDDVLECDYSMYSFNAFSN